MIAGPGVISKKALLYGLLLAVVAPVLAHDLRRDDKHDEQRRALLNLMEFYHHESCGQCTPCREGTGWLEKLVRRIWSGGGRPEDVDLLDRVADTVGGAGAGKTICFLADSAVMPTKSFLQHFRADFESAVRDGGSPVYRARKARIDRRSERRAAAGAAH